jgi:hypothetical protein
MIMANCGQACPYNTLDGCKVKEYNAICPLTNMATPITEYRMTNADRIRAMSDEELEQFINHFDICDIRTNEECKMSYCACCEVCVMDWLQQPAEESAS